MDINYDYDLVKVEAWPEYQGVPEVIHSLTIKCTATLDSQKVVQRMKVALLVEGDPLPDDFKDIWEIFSSTDKSEAIQWALAKMESDQVYGNYAEFEGEEISVLENWKRRMRAKLLDPRDIGKKRRNSTTYGFRNSGGMLVKGESS